MSGLEVFLAILCLVLFSLLIMPGVRNAICTLFQGKYPVALTIYVIIGIVLYLIGFNCIDQKENKVLYTIVIKLADLLILGVFLGIITNAPRFLNVFRESLVSELYSEKHLRQRKDIREIWDKVSKSMFKDKYPDISSDILDIISKHYFPKSDQGYYDHYSVLHEISFLDPNKKYLKDIESISFTYRTFGMSKSFEQSIICCKKDRNDSMTEIFVHSFKINGNENKGQLKSNKYVKEGNLHLDIEMQLPKVKDGVYKIEIQQEKNYLLEDDFDITFASRRIAKDIYAELRYPSNEFYVYFQKFGTVADYSVTNQKGLIKADFKGVILPRQGYSFLLRKI